MIEQYGKKTRVKFTTIKYLYEFAAIPKAVREKYLESLLRCPVTGKKRKNSSTQKNVKLLKIIFRHVEECCMTDWDEIKICRVLGISKDMLYCHKSRLLKGLREFHFGWEKIEKENFPTEKSDGDSNYEISFLKAKRMFEIGMKRESKLIFLKLVRDLETKNKFNFNDKIILFNVYSYMSHYYFILKKRIRFNHYGQKTEELGNSILKIKNESEVPKVRPEILTKLYLSIARRKAFSENKFEQWEGAIEMLHKAFSEAKKITPFSNSVVLQVELLYSIAKLYVSVKKENKAVKYINDALMLTRENGLYPEYLSFKALEHTIEFYNGKISADEGANLILSYYKQVAGLQNSVSIKTKRNIIGDGIRLASASSNRQLLYYLQYKFNSYCLLEGGLNYPSAFTMLYMSKFYYYSDHIHEVGFSRDNDNESEYLQVTGLNKHYMNMLEKSFDEIMLNFHRICNVYFKKSVYIFMLRAEFWKGKNSDPRAVQHIINRMDWLDKSRGKLAEFNKESLELLKFGTKAIEESEYLNKKDFLNKYERRFKEYADSLLNERNDTPVIDYLVLSHIAVQTGYGELRDIIKKIYFKLTGRNLHLFDQVVKEMKEQKSSDYDFNPESLEQELERAA